MPPPAVVGVAVNATIVDRRGTLPVTALQLALVEVGAVPATPAACLATWLVIALMLACVECQVVGLEAPVTTVACLATSLVTARWELRAWEAEG
jgi:hypothetical protein